MLAKGAWGRGSHSRSSDYGYAVLSEGPALSGQTQDYWYSDPPRHFHYSSTPALNLEHW